MKKITFELEQTSKDIELDNIIKRKPNSQKVLIKRNGEVIGHIFAPSGSCENITNAIQICGFTEAFDLWGCGIFKGYKDIQLLFDNGIMGGKDTFSSKKCLRCYRDPCQCENKGVDGEHEADTQKIISPLPFNIKTSNELLDRIKMNNNDAEELINKR